MQRFQWFATSTRCVNNLLPLCMEPPHVQVSITCSLEIGMPYNLTPFTCKGSITCSFCLMTVEKKTGYGHIVFRQTPLPISTSLHKMQNLSLSNLPNMYSLWAWHGNTLASFRHWPSAISWLTLDLFFLQLLQWYYSCTRLCCRCPVNVDNKNMESLRDASISISYNNNNKKKNKISREKGRLKGSSSISQPIPESELGFYDT